METNNCNEWVCFTFLKDLEHKIILVQDIDKSIPHLWKMPGGKKLLGEDFPFQTISRELQQELPHSGFAVVTSEPVMKIKKNHPVPHWFLVFKGTCLQVAKVGKEILKAKAFTESEVLKIIKEGAVVPQHAEVLKKFLNK